MTTGRVLWASLLAAAALAALFVWYRAHNTVVGESALPGPFPAQPAGSAPNHASPGPSPVEAVVAKADSLPEGAHKGARPTPSPPHPGSPDGGETDRYLPPTGLPDWTPPRASERWQLQDANGGDLRGRNWADADLRYIDLSNADLRGADLAGADLLGASLRGADLEGATVATALLLDADLREANLPGLQLGPMNLSSADLRGANLRGVRLASPAPPRRSAVMSSNFAHADLRDSDFGYAVIVGSVFDHADLRGANFANTRGRPRSMFGAKYDERTRLPPRIDPADWGMIKMP